MKKKKGEKKCPVCIPLALRTTLSSCLFYNTSYTESLEKTHLVFEVWKSGVVGKFQISKL
jgi:hypothetical protein